jgi:hypothetical protein
VSETNLAVLIAYSRYLNFTFQIQYQCGNKLYLIKSLNCNFSCNCCKFINNYNSTCKYYTIMLVYCLFNRFDKMLIITACSECGSLNITSTNIVGNRDGRYTVRYASNLAGCKTAEMTCINPAFNYSSSIIAYNTSNNGQSGFAYTLNQMINPLYSTAEFVCNDNGQYAYYSITFDSITCDIASNSPSKLSYDRIIKI